jgi:type VI secretion system secreted protein Hcp
MPIDGFLKIDGIEGECKDGAHEGWLDVTDFDWGLDQEALPAPDGKLAGGTPTVRSAQFTQPFGRASPRLFISCAMGHKFPAMTLEGRLNYGEESFRYLRAEFRDCLITSISTQSTETQITEEVEVVFRSVNVETWERPL